MSEKKVRIVWRKGIDSKGMPINYQSIEEFIPVEPAYVEETKCYHDWEDYKGLLHDDRKCLKCGKVEIL